MSKGKRGLWRCAKCGWKFAHRNQWHSCARVPLGEHFRGKSPRVRKLFDALVEATRRHGPLTVVTSKTRITLMNRVRFVAVSPQKDALRGHLLLMKPHRDKRFTRVGKDGVHEFRLTDAKQLDAGFRRYLAEAYRVGRQEYLEKP